jgi:phage portal protein BeeE
MSIFSNFFKRSNKNESGSKRRQETVFTSTSDVITGRDATSFAAIDLICSSFANLTGSFYDKRTKQALKEHSLYELIQNPNFDETKFAFFYYSAKDYFSEGNCYWYKYDIDGEIVSLFRLNPNRMYIKRNINNQKIYCYEGQEYDYRKILHIPSRF